MHTISTLWTPPKRQLQVRASKNQSNARDLCEGNQPPNQKDMEATGNSGASATRYDVFLSFRGPDTRNNFTDCLYRTMVGQGIETYRDSEELHAGDQIDDLLRAVDNSKICIPILSKGYVSSAWCLRELTRAMELNESTRKQAILPIFFDVTPLDVKLRTELYVGDLKKHERRHGNEIKQQWEAALRKVAEIKGCEVQGKPYGEVIELVVKEVVRKLKVKQKHLAGKLVGVDEHVEGIMALLEVDSDVGVRFVGIHGMGGIGKTTLAKVVFNKLCSRFDGQCSFIENIRESSKGNGLVDLQKTLASDISDSRFVESFSNTDEGIYSIKKRVGSKKVLLVLDDLDKKEQLQKLVGGPDNFGSGSRIIMTTRDKRIIDEENGILAYEVKQMESEKALELFCLHAFNNVSPPDAYQSLSEEVVFMTGGLPLALEVIGSSLRGKNEKIWKAMLAKLKKVPHDEVRATLKISYDVLGYMEKEIFLDIACFFIGENRSRTTYFWDACSLYPYISLEELTDLCLIKIVDDDVIWMHDQLRDLGRDIIREECTQNPAGRSRLWNCEEALEVVKSKERKDKVQALDLVEHHSSPISIVDEELERMPNIKFLELRAGTFVGDVCNYLQKLRWFSWYSPSLDRTMAELHLKNLVVFTLCSNRNAKNWGGWNILKVENKLKVLSLSGCSGLVCTPNFSGCLSLERLSLHDCENLQEVESSIGKLKGLTHLDISLCERLRNLPKEIGELVNLEHLSINDCSAMKKLAFSFRKLASLSELRLENTNITILPDSIRDVKHLSLLYLSRSSIMKLPISIGELTKLKFLSLYGCHNLGELPESIGNLILLEKLDLSGTRIVELPDSVKNLKQLKVLRMADSEIRRLPASIGTLEMLEELCANSCYQLAGELPTEIGKLASLTILDISSTQVCAVPKEIKSLTRLQKLNLDSCSELQELPELPPSLNYLYVGSASLRLISDLSNLTNLMQLHLSSGSGTMQAPQLQWLGKLPKLEKLKWALSSVPVPLAEMGCLSRLRELTLFGVDSFDSVTGGSQFSDLKNLSRLRLDHLLLREIQLDGLESLRDLNVTECKFLEGLLIIPSSLRKLRKMEVSVCRELLEIVLLETMESLEDLRFSFCDRLRGLRGLSNAKKLELLYVHRCHRLELVEGLEELKLLSRVSLCECSSLQWLTNVANSRIPNECMIDISDCEELSSYDGTYGNYREMILHKIFNDGDEIEKDLKDSMEENNIVFCSDSEIPTEQEDSDGFSDLGDGIERDLIDTMEENDIIFCSDSEDSTEQDDRNGFPDLKDLMEENIIFCSDSKDSMEQDHSNGFSDLEDSTKDNGNISCFIFLLMCIIECIYKLIRFFQGRSLRR